jgi:hypothetical protein
MYSLISQYVLHAQQKLAEKVERLYNGSFVSTGISTVYWERGSRETSICP